MRTVAGFVALVAVAVILVSASGPHAQIARVTAGFESVSIRRASEKIGTRLTPHTRIEEKPNGSLTLTNVSVSRLIAHAYPAQAIDSLPDWTRRERYDVIATTTSLSTTAETRLAMLRAMLTEHFKLSVRLVKRAQPVYNLVMIRNDGTLGPGLKRSQIQCPAERVPGSSATVTQAPVPAEPSNFKLRPRPCTLRIVDARIRERHGDGRGRLGDLLEGEVPIADLAQALRPSAGRAVIDKTGLQGTYRAEMNFDNKFARIGPDRERFQNSNIPSVFRALETQLGLRLESWAVVGEVVVVERVERPSLTR